MAFYKKKVEKLAAESAAGFLKELHEIEARAAEVAGINDPAESFLGYADVQEKVSALKKKMRSRHEEANKDWNWDINILVSPLTAVGITAVWGGLTAVAIAAGVVPGLCILLLPFGMVGALPGGLLDGFLRKRNRDILDGSVETLMASLRGLHEHVEEKKREILERALPDLAASTRASELRDKFPEVKDAFAAAAMKLMMEDQPMPLKKINPKR